MPDTVQDLVVKAFTLEALSEKEGCTSRSYDIPGKPLVDFLFAGINSGKYFRMFAEDFRRGYDEGFPPLFKYLPAAIEGSQAHKSQKVLNLGLLEIMFPTVYARMLTNPVNAADIIKLVQVERPEAKEDVQLLIAARQAAWRTSEKRKELKGKYKHCRTPHDFYMELCNEDPTSANYEWGMQFKQGLPVLQHFLDDFRASDVPILEQIALSDKNIRSLYPIRQGIIADMCAAAIFLHLSEH